MVKNLIKEWRVISHIVIYQFLLAMVLLTFGIVFDSNGTLSIIGLILYPMILPTTIVVMDHDFQGVANSLPIRRHTYILTKYIFGYLASMAIVLVGFLWGYVLNESIAQRNIELLPFLSFQGFMFCASPMLLVSGVTLPVFFKFSKREGSIVLMIIYGVLMLGILIGLVFLEKALSIDGMYTENEIFPTLMNKISTYVKTVGMNKISMYFTGIISLYTLSSILLSIFFFNRKDIGE